jgi:hypothetical protein
MTRTKSINFPNKMTELSTLFDKLQRRLANVCLSTAGLVIKSGGSAIVKAGSAFKVYSEGVYVHKAANTDMAALSGTVTNAKFNVFVFTVDASGTLRSYMGTEGATRATMVFPTITDGETVIGFIEVNPTGTGNFVGGTTPLDDATVVPTVVYVNTPFPFIPGIETL